MTQHTIPTLLVIPDEERLSLLFQHLWQNGFGPLFIAPPGDGTLELFYHLAPSLVLIDLHKSEYNIVDLCVEMLRARPATKIALVTDSHTEAPLAALQAGVSGCISRELPLAAWPGLLLYILNGGVAFSRSIVETVLLNDSQVQKRLPLMNIGPLRIDLSQHLTQFAGQRIELTPREFALLTCLARYLDRVVTFDQLLNEAWGYGANDGTPAQVRLYIARLRQKLQKIAQTPEIILTERGIGYRLHSAALQKEGPPL